jgi:hypothetical protein
MANFTSPALSIHPPKARIQRAGRRRGSCPTSEYSLNKSWKTPLEMMERGLVASFDFESLQKSLPNIRYGIAIAFAQGHTKFTTMKKLNWFQAAK